MTRRLGVAALVGVLAAAALAGAWRAATAPGPQSLEARTQAVAATLRCPTCQNLAVADSPSPMARGMRDIIAEQLEAGRTAAQVQAWFVDRYGPWILLYPPREGISWLAWLAPVVALLGAGGLAWRRVGRHERVSLNEEDRTRAEEAYQRHRRGDLVLADGPEDERLSVALELLETVREDHDVDEAASDEGERSALRQLALALDAWHAERAALDAVDEESAEPSGRRATRRRLVGRAAAAAVFAMAVAALLPPAVGPRAVGGIPTGSVPGRTGPEVLSGRDRGLDAEQRAHMDELAEALEADPYDVETRLTLAGSLLAAGLADQAAVHYRQAVSARPDDPVIRLTLSVVLLQLGRHDGAERHAAHVLDDRPDHPEALLLVGLARLAQGQSDGEDFLRRFLGVAPAAHPGLAIARTALGEEP